jgi:hypothetical protein
MEHLVKPEILMSYIYIYIDLRLATLKAISLYLLHNISTLYIAEWFSVSQFCVNTLPATKVALISHECISVINLERVLCSSSFGKADKSLFLSDCTMSEHGTYHKSIPVSQLCVNTLPAIKVALIRPECISVISLESVLRSSSFGKADNSFYWTA